MGCADVRHVEGPFEDMGKVRRGKALLLWEMADERPVDRQYHTC